MHRFANPARFMRVAERLLPWFLGLGGILLLAGLYQGLIASPADYQQHETVRIMYLHVPAAILAQGFYFGMALGSASFLIWKHPLGDLMARAMAPVGAALCFICLVTGAIWGKPTWGTYWVWDARLTSMLILLFLYFGYMALANAFDDPSRGHKPAALLAVVGVVNIPVIKFSVYFFNTLHQKSTLFAEGGPSMDPDMLLALMLMLGALGFLATAMAIIRLRGEMTVVKLRAARHGLNRHDDATQDVKHEETTR